MAISRFRIGSFYGVFGKPARVLDRSHEDGAADAECRPVHVRKKWGLYGAGETAPGDEARPKGCACMAVRAEVAAASISGGKAAGACASFVSNGMGPFSPNRHQGARLIAPDIGQR